MVCANAELALVDRNLLKHCALGALLAHLLAGCGGPPGGHLGLMIVTGYIVCLASVGI